MTPDYQNLLIAVLFASQIAVLSFYTPLRWHQYHSRLFDRYPCEEYPRLHPLPREEVERKLKLFRPLHLVIGAAAILVFLGVWVFGTGLRGMAGPMMMCLLAQVMLPLYVALPLEVRIRQGLNAMPPPSRRAVELRKWRVTDFISPLWIGLAMAIQILAVASAVVVFFYRPDTPGLLFALGISSVLLLVSIFALLGDTLVDRTDPYMSSADTFRARQRTYHGLFLGNAALALWQMCTLLVSADLLQLNAGFGFALFSVIAQIAGLAMVSRQKRDLETRDFSVYRAADAQVAADIGAGPRSPI